MKMPRFFDWVLDFSAPTAEKFFNASHLNFKL